jgi:aryl-alcohol dehydrogenase-like predicted oxidoreductase
VGSRLTEQEGLRDSMLTEARLEKVRDLKQVAGKLEVTRAQLAIAWILRHPAVSSVIMGATKPSQLEDNLKAITLEMTPDVLAEIDRIFPPE